MRVLLFVCLSIVSIMINSMVSSDLFARTLTIESLEGGNCWVGSESGDTFFSDEDFDGVKIVSFPQEKSFTLDRSSFDELNRSLEKAIRKVGINDFSEVQYDLHVKCNHDGMIFLLNLYSGDVKLCAHLSAVEMDGNSIIGASTKFSKAGIGSSAILRIDRLYPNHDMKRGACIGQNPGKLILNLSKEYSENLNVVESCVFEIEKEYKNLFKIHYNENVKGLYVIQLNSDYYYKEHLVKNLILQQSVCGSLVKSDNIEYDNIFMNVGTTHRVYTGTFPGF
ncbi:MAG: hypothetical protein HQK49_11445 [Oligoflexia bacterium]|nr:hypothetical protein [Oligoflexia bacterium]